ncbi:hypothetical protein ACFLS9_06540 [Bacteroidota bacterium]
MESSQLTEIQIKQIKDQVKQAAYDHLHTIETNKALSHFTEDVIAISNDTLFPSYEALAEDVGAFYKILKEVNLASWDDMYINIIDVNVASVTAKFRYSFTSIDNERTDLKGIWTAIYVLRRGKWKICLKHETFIQL